ncbi:MAG TPA: TRAP transporter small permease [Desulfatiglandales bacterium]|nr:TRAP transporter small permease [Desulfatiglandales bacterium]
MFSFQKHFFSLARRLDIIAAMAIFAMMALTCADVFMRIFRKPITGTYEIVSFLGAIAVSFAIAHTSAEKGHVSVSLIVQLFPKKAQGIIEAVISMLGILLFIFIAWQSLVYGMDCQRTGEVSLTLGFPFYPVMYGVAMGAVVECLVLFVDFLTAITKLRDK